MGSEWKEVGLNELGEVARGRSRHRPRYAEHLYGGNYPFIQTGDIKASGGLIISHSQTYSEAGLAQSRLWPTNTMCITIAANIAETGILTYPACFPDSVIGFIADEEKCDVRFIEYRFRYLKAQLQREAIGSVQDNINLATFERLKFSIPTLIEQKKISSILSSLDDKIQLNQQTNQTLEQMAQALFKSWFIDFDPVIDNALTEGNTIPEPLQARAKQRQKHKKPSPSGRGLGEGDSLFPSEFEQTNDPSIGIAGWVPKGWRVSDLSELTIELRRGISPKYAEDAGIKVINQKCIRNHEINFSLCRLNNIEIKKVDGREIELGDVLVNSTGVGTLGRMAQVNNLPEPTVVDSHVTVVRPDTLKCPIYTFGQLMLANEKRVEALGEGSTGQTELSRKILSEQKVVLPPFEIALYIENTFKSFSEKQARNRMEVVTLEKTRDTLLPKLISGELRLNDEDT